MAAHLTWAVCLALPAVLGLSAEPIELAPHELVIAPGQTRTIEFGTLPQQNTTILLEIVARVELHGLAGSNFFLKLTLNGHEIKPARARGLLRLVNRPLVSPVAPNLPSSWFGSGAFRVLYAPDFKCAQKQTFYQGDPYITLLDVTDLTNPAAENRLEITNTARPEQFVGKPGKGAGNLVVGRLTVRTKTEPSPLMGNHLDAAPIVNRGAPGATSAAYRGEFLPGGGFRLTVGKQTWEFSTALSYPDAGLNALVPSATPDRSGQPDWKVVTTPDAQGGQVLAEGPDYRLRRTLRFTPRKVEINDELHNRHADRALGLMVRQQVDLRKIPTPTVRLAGNPDPAVDEYYSPHNPSVHLALGDQALGLLCEDDVFRNQARLFCSTAPPAAGLRTDMLRLAPGETYTLRWSVYPVAGPDYFDFINLVRDDWRANFTVAGAWTFFSPDSILALPGETIRRQFQRQGIRYACYCGGWVDPQHDRKRIGFGTGVMDDYWSDFRARLRAAAARIRQAVPGVKVLVYYDTQRDTSEGPPERFRDSWLTDRHGKQLSTDWSGRYSHTNSMVATLHNSFGRAMLKVADRYLDEMQVDGLYWDEMEAVAYGTPLLTYNQFDGHSCLLDPQRFTIQTEVGLTTLLGRDHRLAVIEQVRRRGGLLMGNGPPCTRATLDTGVQRMVEIQHNDTWCYEGNLATPLGYLSSRITFGDFTRALTMPCLPVGTTYNYTHDISASLFPLTPIALHHGYLLGRERIIVLHSGTYGWPGERCLVRAEVFGSDGKRLSTAVRTSVARQAHTTVELKSGQVAILHRLPVSVGPAASQSLAEVTTVDYSSHGLSLQIKAHREAEITVADGPLPIRAGCKYKLQWGAAPARQVTADASTLRIPLEVQPETSLRLTPDD